MTTFGSPNSRLANERKGRDIPDATGEPIIFFRDMATGRLECMTTRTSVQKYAKQ